MALASGGVQRERLGQGRGAWMVAPHLEGEVVEDEGALYGLELVVALIREVTNDFGGAGEDSGGVADDVARRQRSVRAGLWLLRLFPRLLAGATLSALPTFGHVFDSLVADSVGAGACGQVRAGRKPPTAFARSGAAPARWCSTCAGGTTGATSFARANARPSGGRVADFNASAVPSTREAHRRCRYATSTR